MSSKIDRRLKRLAESGGCSCENDSQHAGELKELPKSLPWTCKTKSNFSKLADNAIEISYLRFEKCAFVRWWL
jgi:hypothetical protein